jgi:hypothetical protein
VLFDDAVPRWSESAACASGTNLAFTWFERNDLYREASMRELLISVAVLPFALGVAIAQPTGTAGNPSLSLDQQSRISEIITNQTPQPLTGINFSIAPDVVVPPNVALQRLPAEAEKLAPQFQGYSYLAVEELVAIVDTNSRRISSVMQRMRRQGNTKSGQ